MISNHIIEFLMAKLPFLCKITLLLPYGLAQTHIKQEIRTGDKT